MTSDVNTGEKSDSVCEEAEDKVAVGESIKEIDSVDEPSNSVADIWNEDDPSDSGLSVDGDKNISADKVGINSVDELSSVVRVDVGSWALSVQEDWSCWGELDVIEIVTAVLSLELNSEETIALGLASVILLVIKMETGMLVEPDTLKEFKDSRLDSTTDDGLSVDGDSNISDDEVGSISMDELSSVVSFDVGSWALSVPEGWSCWGELDAIGIATVVLSLELKTEETITLGLASVIVLDITMERGMRVE